MFHVCMHFSTHANTIEMLKKSHTATDSLINAIIRRQCPVRLLYRGLDIVHYGLYIAFDDQYYSI